MDQISHTMRNTRCLLHGRNIFQKYYASNLFWESV